MFSKYIYVVYKCNIIYLIHNKYLIQEGGEERKKNKEKRKRNASVQL